MINDIAAAAVLRYRDRLVVEVIWTPFTTQPMPHQRAVGALQGQSADAPTAVGALLREALDVSAQLLDGGAKQPTSPPLRDTFNLLGFATADTGWNQIRMVQIFVSPPNLIDIHATKTGPAFAHWSDLGRVSMTLPADDSELGLRVLEQLSNSRNEENTP